MGAGRKKMLSNPVSVTLDVEADELARLRAIAEAEGVSTAEMIRRAISLLAGDRRPRPRRRKTSREE